MSRFEGSEYGFAKAGIASPFKRIVNGEAEGNFFCIVDKSSDGSSTFGTGCEVESGDAPVNGDPIGTATFGQFTKVVITGTAYCYEMP